MKNVVFISALGIITMLSSCNLDDSANPRSPQAISYRSGLDIESIDSTFVPTCADAEDIFSRISTSDGVLVFDSIAHFENCIKCLEDLLEAHLAQFDATYAAYSVEQRDSIEIATGFHYYEPLEDFEANFDYDSRRELIELQIEAWLNQSNPVFSSAYDPDEQDDLNEVERTLLNEDGEVIIHGTLIDLTDVSAVSSVSCFPSSDGCKRFEKSKDYPAYPNDNNKRIKVKLVNRSWPWKIKIEGRLVNLRKKGNRWVRARTNMYMFVLGRFADSDCGSQEDVRCEKGPKKRKTISTHFAHYGFETWAKHVCQEQNGYYEIVGNFYTLLNH